jgi:hypothetical protein
MTVEFSEQGMADVTSAFEFSQEATLFGTLDQFLHFVKETLSRDIRSVTQRIPERDERARLHTGAWRVVLCGIDIAYDIGEDNTVTICGCSAT